MPILDAGDVAPEKSNTEIKVCNIEQSFLDNCRIVLPRNLLFGGLKKWIAT
jgi:hypothetical protein